MTFLSPLILVGIFTLVAYLSNINNDNVRTITILDESQLFVDQFEDTESIDYKQVSDISLAEAKKLAETSEYYGLLYIPKTQTIDELANKITFYSEDSPSLTIMGDIQNAIEDKVNTEKLQEAGIDSKKIEELRQIDNQIDEEVEILRRMLEA